MPTGPQVILILKIAVTLATLLLAASVYALVIKRPRIHGQINVLVAVLLLGTVVVFEGLIRLMGVDVTGHMDSQAMLILKIHLAFVIPLIPYLILMLVSGLGRKIKLHRKLVSLFVFLWVGMFVTGLLLPHT